MRTAGLIVLGSVLIATACRGPHPEAPVIPPGGPAGFSAAGGAARPDAWWTALGDETLNQLVEQALTNNFSLRAAWDRLAQAEAIAARQGAATRPSLDASGSFLRTRREVDAGGAVYDSEYGAGLVASYELDVWGRVRSVRDAAALDAAASAEQVQAAAITLSAELSLAWVQWIEQRGQIELLMRQIETSSRALDVLNQRFRIGQASAADVLQQEQLVEARRGDLSAAAARASVLEHRVAVLTGRPAGSPVPVPGAMLPLLLEWPETGVPADVLARRPDVRRAWNQVLAADRRLDAAAADRLPAFSIVARVSSSAPEADDLFSNWLASLAANLTAPLIDGGARRAEVRRTRAATSEAIHAYGETVLQALAEVENALVQEQRQRETLQSLDRQLELADEAWRRIRDRYLGGAEDFLRVLTAEVTQQSLERNRLQAARQLIEYRIALYRALAGPLPLARPEPATLESFTASSGKETLP